MIDGKKYHHRYPGAKFFMSDGREICFAGGEFDTANLAEELRAGVHQELDKIANVPASMIYTKEPIPDLGETSAAEEVMRDATASFDTVNKIPAGTSTVALGMPKADKPTLAGNLAASATKAREAIAGAGKDQAAPPKKA